MIERTHRVIKERLCARGAAPGWMDHLPMVLLGIRTSPRADTGLSPADLVFGSPLRLPGELLEPPDPSLAPPTSEFVSHLRRVMSRQRPAPAAHHRQLGDPEPHLPASLLSAPFVYVRIDAVRRPLTRPYEGPYKVLASGPKTFSLLRAGKPWIVSTDRLKAALGWIPDSSSSPTAVSSPRPPLPSSAGASRLTDRAPPAPAPVPSSSPAAAALVPPSRPSYAAVLRSGRVSRPPKRFDSQ